MKSSILNHMVSLSDPSHPQVAAHLFQAGANIVKLGIQKTDLKDEGRSPDEYLGLY